MIDTSASDDAPRDPERDPSAMTMAELKVGITGLHARIAAATARWLALVAEFDRREGWAGQGLKSCAHWLGWQCGLAPNTAREHVRVARALTALPLVQAAFSAGAVSFAKVRALTRVADADSERDLLDVALAGTGAHVEKVARAWRRVETVDDPPHEPRRLTHHVDDLGRLRIAATLSAEEGALFLTALEAARELARATAAPAADPQEAGLENAPSGLAGPVVPPPPDRAQVTHADAFMTLIERFLDPEPSATSMSDRHQVVVHVDADVLAADTAAGAAHLDNGPALRPEQIQRIACDARLVVMLRRGRDVLDVGRSTRVIPPALKRALWFRDGGCRFPGCDETRRNRVDGHHIRYWSRGGRTSLPNLVLLCRFHHHSIHEGGFTVASEPDGHLFRAPDGTPLDTTATYRATGALARVAPSPIWSGEQLDLGYAISVLMDRRRFRAERRGRAMPPDLAAVG